MKCKTNLKRNLVFYCVSLILLFPNAVNAHQWCYSYAMQDSLDKVLEEYSIENNIKGISASVNIGYGNVWRGNYGVSHNDIAICNNTLFGIGSISKSFSSIIILQLYEKGRLSIYDPISNWIAPHEKIDSSITIEQLLNHTSGIFNYTENPAIFGPIFTEPEKNWTLEDILPYLNDPYFAPGEGYHYSNTNYFLAGKIIEAVTGKSLEHEMKKRILNPLRLKRTSLYMESRYLDDLSHVWSFDGTSHTDNSAWNATPSMFTFAWAAGGILSTAKEITNYGTGLFHCQRFLHDTTMYKMKNEEENGYGYGVMVGDYERYGESTKTYGHYGDIGYRSGLVYIPEDKVTIGVLCNQNNDVYNELLPLLYAAILNQPQAPMPWKEADAEAIAELELKVYPNPATEVLYVDNWSTSGDVINYSIYDRNGKLVQNGVFDGHSIQISGLSTGIYFLNLDMGVSSQTQKIVVQ